jgi:hypothetical protein
LGQKQSFFQEMTAIESDQVRVAPSTNFDSAFCMKSLFSLARFTAKEFPFFHHTSFIQLYENILDQLCKNLANKRSLIKMFVSLGLDLF